VRIDRRIGVDRAGIGRIAIVVFVRDGARIFEAASTRARPAEADISDVALIEATSAELFAEL